MRGTLLKTILGLALAASAGAQTMTEFGAAAAGGTAGGVAGKKVSEGITAIFGKVDQQAKAAAKDPAKPDKPASAPAASASANSTAPAPASSGAAPASAPLPRPRPKTVSAPKAPVRSASASRTAKPVYPPSVPDPPALQSHPTVVSKAPAPPPLAVALVPVVPPPPPPPPPEVTAENLKSVQPGTPREDVLKLGPPAYRITMFGDDGHLLEIYSYMTKSATLGVVRLSDGAVSKVELR